jgi:hypothetical protein
MLLRLIQFLPQFFDSAVLFDEFVNKLLFFLIPGIHETDFLQQLLDRRIQILAGRVRRLKPFRRIPTDVDAMFEIRRQTDIGFRQFLLLRVFVRFPTLTTAACAS